MFIVFPKVKFYKGACQGCILGKHPEHKYERVNHERTFGPLELIHSGISGPFHLMSMIQTNYVLTVTNDFSRYCCVYFLKLKFEVFYLFKVFKSLVENQSGRKLKTLRSGNDDEYLKYKFIKYCKYVGIHMQHSIPYTPHQNGDA